MQRDSRSSAPAPAPRRAYRLAALGAVAVAGLLQGCASTQDVTWDRVAVRDRHAHMNVGKQERPTAMFFAGASGTVVNLGEAPANRLVASGSVQASQFVVREGGQVELVRVGDQPAIRLVAAPARDAVAAR